MCTHTHTHKTVSYPATHPELCLPQLEGKTAKMYRGGKICLVRRVCCCVASTSMYRPMTM